MLPDADPSRRAVRIGISAQEESLKKEQARIPHRRRSTQIRQNHFADHRLDAKQKCSAQTESERIEPEQTVQSLDSGKRIDGL
jgi:hypothetical protein